MGRALIVLRTKADRAKAAGWIAGAPVETRVEFKSSKRSLPQNDKLWAMLTEVSEQVEWYGRKLKPDDWKDVFTAGLRRELRMVPNLNGDGYVALGMRTSDMTKDEMSQLIELVYAFGAEHGVIFKERSEAA